MADGGPADGNGARAGTAAHAFPPSNPFAAAVAGAEGGDKSSTESRAGAAAEDSSGAAAGRAAAGAAAPSASTSAAQSSLPDDANILPVGANTVERYVFCIDISAEMGEQPFGKINTGSRMHYVHKCINSLVHTKLQMEPRSEFAIYCLAPSSCVLIQDFTRSPGAIRNALLSVAPIDERIPELDMDEMFTTLEREVVLQAPPGPPPNLTHAVLIYGRSTVVPTLSPAVRERLMSNTSFVLDILYLHDSPVTDVFNFFADFDPEGRHLYLVETHSSLKSLYRAMAMFTGHPYKRPVQDASVCTLEASE